jgi:hypothetical protein
MQLRATTRFRLNCQLASDTSRTLPHIGDAVTIAGPAQVEAPAIVYHDQLKVALRNSDGRMNVPAGRMLHYIIYTLFENQENMSAHVGGQNLVFTALGDSKIEFDIPSGEHVAGESPHVRYQIC